MMWKFVAVIGVTQMLMATAAADVYRCTNAHGESEFGDRPCGQTAQKLDIKPAGPDVNAERSQKSRPGDRCERMIAGLEGEAKPSPRETELTEAERRRALDLALRLVRNEFATCNPNDQARAEAAVKRRYEAMDRRVQQTQSTAELKRRTDAREQSCRDLRILIDDYTRRRETLAPYRVQMLERSSARYERECHVLNP